MGWNRPEPGGAACGPAAGPAAGDTPGGTGPGTRASAVASPAASPVASCHRLTVRYPGRPKPALQDLTLTLAAGQRVLLLGPSGSGKSTLALALAGLIPAVVEAQVRGELQPARRAGVLFQDPEAQFCLFTVDEEVAFGLENRCVPPAEMPPRIARALDRAGLAVPFGHPIHALSGGQKQRLALAGVLVLEPDVLILDEPTAQLDSAGRALVLENLWALDRRTTVLVVEHNLDGVVEWVDRVVVLGPDGRLLADGTPQQVFTSFRQVLERDGIWRPRRWGPFWAPVLREARDRWPGETAASPGGEGRAPAGAAARPEAPGTGGEAPADRPAAPAPRPDPPGDPGEGPRTDAGTDPAPLVRLESVTATRGARVVWSGVTLSLGAGEWVAVLGGNGTGKSTFLQVAAGLHPPAAGRVVHAPALAGRRGGPAQAGFVFQNPEHQFVTDTVYDEIALAGRLAGWPEEVLRPRVDQLIRRFGLEGLEQVHPYTLSQGQKRRLSVASMLVVPRPILFLDEPTFGQDARTAAALVAELAALHRQGTTLVMATHDLELAAAAATRVLVFGQGRLLYDGPPEPLWDEPGLLEAAGLAAAPGAPWGARSPNGRLRGPAGAGAGGPVDGVAARGEGGARGRGAGEPGGGGAGGAVGAAVGSGVAGAGPASGPRPQEGAGRPQPVPWACRVHPAWKLAVHLALAAVILATGDPRMLAALLAVPVLVGGLLGGIGLRRWLVALAPFVLVAGTRLWTLGAFGRGEQVVGQILWYRFTAEGLESGLVVGLRLLGLGALGVLYAGTTGLADLVLGLMQQWRLSPRWAYGLLAALRFVPLFQEELERVRQAYRVRGLTGRGPLGRLRAVYRYSLALLVHAIRTAEVVAVALQARGFDGSRRRTYYRTLPAGWREVAYAVLLLAASGLALWLAGRLA